LLKKGDIIIVNKGTRFNTFLYNEAGNDVVSTTAFYVITSSKDVIPEYLYWYLNQEEAKEYLTANVQGSVIPTITKNIVAQLPIPLIPLDAQQYVNTFIRKVMLNKNYWMN
jgi:restriction endonuclease S subunit